MFVVLSIHMTSSKMWMCVSNFANLIAGCVNRSGLRPFPCIYYRNNSKLRDKTGAGTNKAGGLRSKIRKNFNYCESFKMTMMSNLLNFILKYLNYLKWICLIIWLLVFFNPSDFFSAMSPCSQISAINLVNTALLVPIEIMDKTTHIRHHSLISPKI